MNQYAHSVRPPKRTGDDLAEGGNKRIRNSMGGYSPVTRFPPGSQNSDSLAPMDIQVWDCDKKATLEKYH